jgi:hypothetical protein
LRGRFINSKPILLKGEVRSEPTHTSFVFGSLV